jgi:hypothetical protein
VTTQGRHWAGDESALRALSASYAAAADARDGERFAALFAPGAELVVPDYPRDLRPVVVRSGDELRRIPVTLGRYLRTLHQVTDWEFAAADGAVSATGIVGCVAHHVRRSDDPAGPPGTDTVWYLRYCDEYRRVGGAWRFGRRELHLRWVEERPVSALS